MLGGKICLGYLDYMRSADEQVPSPLASVATLLLAISATVPLLELMLKKGGKISTVLSRANLPLPAPDSSVDSKRLSRRA